MSEDPYRGTTPTRPKQRAVPRGEPRLRDDDPTLHRCPLCAGGGGVTVDQVELFDKMIEKYKESA